MHLSGLIKLRDENASTEFYMLIAVKELTERKVASEPYYSLESNVNAELASAKAELAKPFEHFQKILNLSSELV